MGQGLCLTFISERLIHCSKLPLLLISISKDEIEFFKMKYVRKPKIFYRLNNLQVLQENLTKKYLEKYKFDL